MQLYFLGYIFLNQDNFDEAEICYKKMINLDPLQAKGYYNLGIIFEKQKENTCLIYSLYNHV